MTGAGTGALIPVNVKAATEPANIQSVTGGSSVVEANKIGRCPTSVPQNNTSRGWLRFRNDIARSGRTNSTGPIATETAVAWRHDVGVGQLLPMVAADEGIFATKAYPTSETLVIDRRRGELHRSKEHGGLSYAPPEMVPDNLVVSRHNIPGETVSSLSTINKNSLDRGKKIALGNDSVSAQLSGGDISIVATVGHPPQMNAYHIPSGETCWGLELSPPITEITSIACRDGIVYLTAAGVSDHTWDTGICLAIDPATGDQIWGTEFNQPAHDVAVHDSGPLVHVAGAAYSLDKATGKPLWKQTITGGAREAPIIVDNKAVIGGNHNVTAIDVETGEVEWRHGLHGNVVRVRAGNKSLFYAASSIGNKPASVGSLDKDGSVNWEVSLGMDRVLAPIILDNQMVIGISTPPKGQPGTDTYRPETSEIIAFE